MVCCCELTGGNSENETSRVRSEKLQGEYHEVKVSDFALYLEDYMMDECPTLGYVSDTPFDPKLKVGHGPVTFYFISWSAFMDKRCFWIVSVMQRLISI